MEQDPCPYYEEYYHLPSDDALKNLFYIRSMGHYRCSQTHRVRMNRLTDYHFIYTISGKGYLEINQNLYVAEKDTVLFFPTYLPHCYYSDKNDLWEHYYIYLGGTATPLLYDNITRENGNLILVSKPEYHKVRLIKLFDLIRSNDSLGEIRESCLLNELLTDICSQPRPETKYPPFIEKAINYIETSYNTREASAGKIASRLRVNRSYFSRIFKSHTKMSPKEFILHIRLSNARNLVVNSDMSIKEIAHFSGFPSEKSLIQYFKLRLGSTPIKYRKNRKEQSCYEKSS